MFHEEALGEATPALVGEVMVEARGVEKAYALGDVRVHALSILYAPIHPLSGKKCSRKRCSAKFICSGGSELRSYSPSRPLPPTGKISMRSGGLASSGTTCSTDALTLSMVSEASSSA